VSWFSQLLDGMPHPPSKGQDSERRGDADKAMMIGSEDFQANCYRDEDKERMNITVGLLHPGFMQLNRS
jgi:hypothetical protein